MLADTNPKMRGYFNPRSREGSDFTCRLKGSCINISIRAPTRGATIIGMLLTLSSRFQSALPRGERLVSVQIVILQLKISIRAPARGATLPPFPHSRPYVISIRAPARGATYAYRMYQTDTEISIRAPARGATLLHRVPLFDTYISIRAPARGATFRGKKFSTIFVNFNPRSREGSDATEEAAYYGFEISIRAPARGATSICTSISVIAVDFNPRSREGSDLLAVYILVQVCRFQSALPRGERLPGTSGKSLKLLFQSALPRGERQDQT